MGSPALSKAHYNKHKEMYKARGKLRRELFRDIIREMKNVPCADCSKMYPYPVMEFHHLDAATKKYKVSHLGHIPSEQKLRAEIAKCIVLCANCHRLRSCPVV